LAVVSSRCDLDPRASLFSGSTKPLLITATRAAEARPDLAAVADIVTCGEVSVDLARAVEALAGAGLGRAVCEGGPSLFRSLLLAGLVDELCLTTAAVLAGADHRHLTGNGPLPETVPFSLRSLIEGDGMLIARYSTVAGS
jgi:riboflavin biosynthesis pyrimidine reductase